jgi:hypothetical protein
VIRLKLPDRYEELEAFKTRIDLREVMAARGHVLDERSSSRSYSVMRHPRGDKLIVTRKANRHWIYANVHDARDRGTVIDFVGYRDGLSLGEIRRALRPWLSGGLPLTPASRVFAELAISPPDSSRVFEAWEQAEPIGAVHNYLLRERRTPSEVLSDPIFAGVIRTDVRRNALFAHFNRDGLCGFEIKNRGFTGFSPGGTKGLFYSRPRPDDGELVVCETAIDLLSYAALFGVQRKRFLSVAGQISPAQEQLLVSAAQKMPSGGTTVLALDNDPGGRQLAAKIAQLFGEHGLETTTHLPDREGDDWNDVLRRRGQPAPDFPTPV